MAGEVIQFLFPTSLFDSDGFHQWSHEALYFNISLWPNWSYLSMVESKMMREFLEFCTIERRTVFRFCQFRNSLSCEDAVQLWYDGSCSCRRNYFHFWKFALVVHNNEKYSPVGIGPKKSSETFFHGAEGSGVAIVGSGLIGPAWHASQLFTCFSAMRSIPGNYTFSRSKFFVFTIP